MLRRGLLGAAKEFLRRRPIRPDRVLSFPLSSRADLHGCTVTVPGTGVTISAGLAGRFERSNPCYFRGKAASTVQSRRRATGEPFYYHSCVAMC